MTKELHLPRPGAWSTACTCSWTVVYTSHQLGKVKILDTDRTLGDFYMTKATTDQAGFDDKVFTLLIPKASVPRRADIPEYLRYAVVTGNTFVEPDEYLAMLDPVSVDVDRSHVPANSVKIEDLTLDTIMGYCGLDRQDQFDRWGEMLQVGDLISDLFYKDKDAFAWVYENHWRQRAAKIDHLLTHLLNVTFDHDLNPEVFQPCQDDAYYPHLDPGKRAKVMVTHLVRAEMMVGYLHQDTGEAATFICRRLDDIEAIQQARRILYVLAQNEFTPQHIYEEEVTYASKNLADLVQVSQFGTPPRHSSTSLNDWIGTIHFFESAEAEGYEATLYHWISLTDAPEEEETGPPRWLLLESSLEEDVSRKRPASPPSPPQKVQKFNPVGNIIDPPEYLSGTISPDMDRFVAIRHQPEVDPSTPPPVLGAQPSWSEKPVHFDIAEFTALAGGWALIKKYQDDIRSTLATYSNPETWAAFKEHSLDKYLAQKLRIFEWQLLTGLLLETTFALNKNFQQEYEKVFHVDQVTPDNLYTSHRSIFFHRVVSAMVDGTTPPFTLEMKPFIPDIISFEVELYSTDELLLSDNVWASFVEYSKTTHTAEAMLKNIEIVLRAVETSRVGPPKHYVSVVDALQPVVKPVKLTVYTKTDRVVLKTVKDLQQLKDFWAKVEYTEAWIKMASLADHEMKHLQKEAKKTYRHKDFATRKRKNFYHWDKVRNYKLLMVFDLSVSPDVPIATLILSKKPRRVRRLVFFDSPLTVWSDHRQKKRYRQKTTTFRKEIVKALVKIPNTTDWEANTSSSRINTILNQLFEEEKVQEEEISEEEEESSKEEEESSKEEESSQEGSEDRSQSLGSSQE